jgi:glycerate 2-kinase
MSPSPRPTLVEAAERVWREALAAVEPRKLVRKAAPSVLGEPEPGGRPDIRLVAFGKAAPAMAAGLMDAAGDRIAAGIVVARAGEPVDLGARFRILEASHPHPDERSVRAGMEILGLARASSGRAGERIVLLLSGGGSAQVCAPAEGIALADKSATAALLMRRGADIHELNTVRKHLSAIKGGRLAAAAFPARVDALILSDVLGDDLGTIASGPVSPDPTTFADARRVIDKYGAWKDVPDAVRAAIAEGEAGARPETLKAGDPRLGAAGAQIIGNNRKALKAGRVEAESLGFEGIILTDADQGGARDAAKDYAALLRRAIADGKGRERPLCLLAGGELTVHVRGKGRGGRNQEFVLAALGEMSAAAVPADARWVIASLGTDGIDGNSDAAGAWIDEGTARRARDLGLDPGPYLADNDSTGFFERAGGLIRTGPTGTNVMDLRLFLLDRRDPVR